jgi:tetratricopeptide (TPR) repeat protein
MNRVAIAALIFAGLALVAPGIVHAAGGGGWGGRPAHKDQPSDFEKAEDLIEDEQYEQAIPLLQKLVADNPADADAWNYLGYCSRKLGKLDESLGYYKKALGLDPEHKGAHEYLGELYLQMNDVPKAEEQLTVLKTLCPDGCEEREDLEKVIAEYKTAHPEN